MSEKIKTIQKGITSSFELLDEDRKVKFFVSSESIDRDGDIVRQEGIKFDTFDKNPIVLYNHNRSMPIARVTGRSMEEGKMAMEVTFPEKGVSEESDKVFGLIKAGVLSATSIGFLPIEYGWLEGGDVFEYKEIELLELSVVTIPANPDAVAIERSFKDEAEKPEIPEEEKEIIRLTQKDKMFLDLQRIKND